MTEKQIVPINNNLLYQDKFKFVLQDAKHVEFFCTKANLPGVSMQYQTIPTPTNTFFLGGKKLNYEELHLEFRVSEDLSNYKEIFNWLVGIVGPQDTEQYTQLTTSKSLTSKVEYNITCDATLFSLTNASNANIMINFKNLMPFSLSGLNMDLEGSSTITASASFRYDYYTIG